MNQIKSAESQDNRDNSPEDDGDDSESGENADDAEQLDDDGNDDDEDDEEDDEELNRYWPPPVGDSVSMRGSNGAKPVSAFAFNNSGGRFAAGGFDHSVRIWDFQAIDKEMTEPICTTQPCGQTVIKRLEYSPSDELVLVISTSCQATIMASDGIVDQKNQCAKGDQYLSDMSHTKGHVNMLNDGSWNPKDQGSFITCSQDSTIRIWDLSKLSQQRTVIKTRSPVSGLKAVPNVCKFSRDALSIITGCNDGTVMLWDTRRKFITTSACIRNAHLKGSEITGIDFSYGSSNKICTRSEDESCKVWDLRNPKQPIASRVGDLTSLHSSDCSFSPDDKLVVVGTSNTKQDPGQLLFLDAENLSTRSSIDVADASVICARWHPKINHIGFTCSNGIVNLTYDKRRSLGGGFLSSGAGQRGTKRKKYVSQRQDNSSSLASKKIITPHSLPLFRDDQSSSSSTSFARIRQDPKRSYKPQTPVTGISQGGRVKPAGSTLSSYIAKNIAKPKDDGGLDIRERILRHAEEAEREPLWIKPSALATPPVPTTAAITTTSTSATTLGAAKAKATETTTTSNQTKRSPQEPRP